VIHRTSEDFSFHGERNPLPYPVLKTMKAEYSPAEVNIHLRARAHDKALIDQAAELVGTNRSQFMLASALKEARQVILDQTSLYVNNQTFQKMLDWLDAPATQEQTEGMERLRAAHPPWAHE
jgi:uncharacterized protein (DUF1778 family)